MAYKKGSTAKKKRDYLKRQSKGNRGYSADSGSTGKNPGSGGKFRVVAGQFATKRAAASKAASSSKKSSSSTTKTTASKKSSK